MDWGKPPVDNPESGVADYPALRQYRAVLESYGLLAPAVLGGAGVLLFLGKMLPLLGRGLGLGERVEIGVWAVIYLGGFGILALLARSLFRAGAELVKLWIHQARAMQQGAALLEREVVPALSQLLKHLRELDLGRESSPVENGKVSAPVKEIREPVKSKKSSEVTSPKAGAAPQIAQMAVRELVARIKEARQTEDAETVLELRAVLVEKLPEGKRLRLDRKLAQWFSRHFQKALRAGQAPLVAPTLAKVVDAFADLEEIQHLVDALPMVRRSVGLCGHCGRPYRGASSRCPACQEEEDE